MSALFAIFIRDLKRSTKEKHFLINRSSLIFIAAIIVFFACTTFYSYRNSNLGRDIINPVSYTVFVLILLSGSTLAAQSINREIEKKTLGLLIMTKLSYHKIVWGKFIQHFFSILLNAISTLPIFLYCATLGGISSLQVLHIFLIFAGILSVTTSLGLLASAISSSKRASGVGVIFMILFVAVSYPIAPVFNGLHQVLIGFSFVQCYTDFAFRTITSLFILHITAKYLSTLYQARLHNQSVWKRFSTNRKQKRSLANKTIDIGQIQPTQEEQFQPTQDEQIQPVQEEQKVDPSVLQTMSNLEQARSIQNTRTKKSRKIKGNPITWRDSYFVLNQSKWRPLYISFLFIFIAFVTQNELKAFPAVAFTIFFLLFISSCSTSFQKSLREIKKKSWSLLLMTSLSNKEIIRGKLKAILKVTYPYLLFTLLFLIISIVQASKLRGQNLVQVAGFSIWIIACLYDLMSYSLYCAFVCKNQRGTNIRMVITLIVWNFLSAFIYLPLYNIGLKDLIYLNFLLNIAYAVLHICLGNYFLKYIAINLRNRINFE